jgi:sugar O-acyltransferase (sialic acid O-acetyltransferase NeuD family)
MTSLDPIIVFGAGGFGREAAALIDDLNAVADRWRMVGFVDDAPQLAGSTCIGFPVFGSLEDALRAAGPAPYFVVGVGTPRVRAALAERLEAEGARPATLVHPSVVVGPRVSIGAGAIVAAGAIIGPDASLGPHCLVNVAGGVGHGAVIGAATVVCPGARVSGDCRIGERVLVGSNAVIAPGRRVGDDSVVGALSFVVRHVPAATTVVGNPATAVGAVRP